MKQTHPYLYARGNPIRYRDPSGYCIPGVDCPGDRYGDGEVHIPTTPFVVPPTASPPMIRPTGAPDWCSNPPPNIPLNQVYILCAQQPTCAWEPMPDDLPAYWLMLAYKKLARLNTFIETVNPLEGIEAEAPIPWVPVVNVGVESEIQHIVHYGGIWPSGLAYEESYWVTKPKLGAGVPDVANFELGLELSSQGTINNTLELSFDVGPGAIELQSNQVMFKVESGWSPGGGVKIRGPDYQFLRINWEGTHEGYIRYMADYHGIRWEKKP